MDRVDDVKNNLLVPISSVRLREFMDKAENQRFTGSLRYLVATISSIANIFFYTFRSIGCLFLAFGDPLSSYRWRHLSENVTDIIRSIVAVAFLPIFAVGGLFAPQIFFTPFPKPGVVTAKANTSTSTNSPTSTTSTSTVTASGSGYSGSSSSASSATVSNVVTSSGSTSTASSASTRSS